jgi:hypothetical protein
MQENVKGCRRQWRGEAMGPGFTVAAESVPSNCLSFDKEVACTALQSLKTSKVRMYVIYVDERNIDRIGAVQTAENPQST